MQNKPFAIDMHCNTLAERVIANDCGVYGPRVVCVKIDPGCKLHYSADNRLWLGATMTDGSRITYDMSKPKGQRMTAHAA